MKSIVLYMLLLSIGHQIVDCNSDTNVDSEKLVMTEKVCKFGNRKCDSR